MAAPVGTRYDRVGMLRDRGRKFGRRGRDTLLAMGLSAPDVGSVTEQEATPTRLGDEPLRAEPDTQEYPSHKAFDRSAPGQYRFARRLRTLTAG